MLMPMHSENMLCAMLASSQANVRKLAVERNLFRRTSTSNEVRKFIKPKINFSAQTYYELIKGEHRIESTLTCDLSIDYLSSLSSTHTFPNYPCHTQSVERHIRLVSTSCKIASRDDRDARIAATIVSCNMMPCFRSKQDYVFS